MINAYYFLFSLTTFFIVIVHTINVISIKMRGKVVIRTYLSEVSKHENASKLHSKYALMPHFGILILSAVNLSYAVYVMLQDPDRQRAIYSMVITLIIMLIVLVVIVLGTRNLYKKE